MKNKAAIYLCLGLMMTYAPLFSQTENAPGSIGISASVQGDQFSFLVPIWLDEHFSLAPAVEIRSATAIGTEYGIGIVPRYYFDREKVAPFIGARAGAILYQPAKVNGINPTSTTDILVGALLGQTIFLIDISPLDWSYKPTSLFQMKILCDLTILGRQISIRHLLFF